MVSLSDKPLLSYKEAALRSGLSVTSIRRAVDAGDIDTVKVGEGTQRICRKIRPAALDDFIARRTTPAKANQPRRRTPPPTRKTPPSDAA